jgi:hypothetical protein
MASASDSALTAQVLVILKYFTFLTSFPTETTREAVSSRQSEGRQEFARQVFLRLVR